MTVKTEYPHVILAEGEVAYIEGTSMKVTELVVERLAYGWSPEELHIQHPYLTLSQIHAAMAYYWDHSAHLDEEIATRLKKVDKLLQQAKSEPSSLMTRLKAQGLL